VTKRAKLSILVVVVIALGGAAAYTAVNRRERGVEVRLEEVQYRDLVSSITATGVVQPHSVVEVSAEITGKILELNVTEGQLVTRGQLLLRIDPAQYQVAVQRAEAAHSSAKAQAAQSAANALQAKRTLERREEVARKNPGLVSLEELEQLRTQVEVTRAVETAGQHAVAQALAGIDEAKSALAKTAITSPISGMVTRLNIKEGETAILGTMNRATGVLMTIADMSRLQTKVRVSEAEITSISRGDSAVVEIDAFRDTTFVGRVVEIAHSATMAPGAAPQPDATVHYTVTVELLHAPSQARMDYSALARIITDRREHVLAIPIISLAVRELDTVATEELPRGAGGGPPPREVGQVDREGVFVVGADNKVTFRPVKVGIASDRYFEVLDGLTAGERIVAGTYQAIRSLQDGMLIRQAATDSLKAKGATR
jgi:HlyD family secretion protein